MCEMTREISCKALRYSNVVLEESLGATGELTVVKDEEGGIGESSASRINISVLVIQNHPPRCSSHSAPGRTWPEPEHQAASAFLRSASGAGPDVLGRRACVRAEFPRG